MNRLKIVVCWVMGHRWSVTHVGPHEIVNYGPCLRCGKKAG